MVTTPMADLGNIGGIAVSFITKSGTNQIARFRLRLPAQHRTRRELRPVLPGRQNQWIIRANMDSRVGGPVYIPHVYDGRNKTFLWFNWGHVLLQLHRGRVVLWGSDGCHEGRRFFSLSWGRRLAPMLWVTPSMRVKSTTPIPRRPLEARLSAHPYGSGSTLNMIPSTAFDATSAKYQTFFPEPTVSGNPNGANYSTAGAVGSSPNSYCQLDIDQNIGTKDRIAGTHWEVSTPTPTPLPLPLILEVFTGSLDDGKFAHLNWTHTFTNNLVEAASFGFDRGILTGNPPRCGKQRCGDYRPSESAGAVHSLPQHCGGIYDERRAATSIVTQIRSRQQSWRSMTIGRWRKANICLSGASTRIHFNANFPHNREPLCRFPSCGNLSPGFRYLSELRFSDWQLLCQLSDRRG